MLTSLPKFHGSKRCYFAQAESCTAGKISGALKEWCWCSSEACHYSSSGWRKCSLGVKDHHRPLSISSSKRSLLLCGQNNVSEVAKNRESWRYLNLWVHQNPTVTLTWKMAPRINLELIPSKSTRLSQCIYASAEFHPSFLVYLLHTYLHRLLHNTFQKDVFYLRPKNGCGWTRFSMVGQWSFRQQETVDIFRDDVQGCRYCREKI